MKSGLWIKFPIFLAIFFCVYAYGLIANSVETYGRLKEKEAARIVAENAQRAATFGDYLAEQRRFVGELAQGAEIANFLANRALGMSLQYGLRSSLDAVDEAFHRALAERRVGDEPLYSRFAFLDEAGARLVDTSGRLPPPAADTIGSQPRLTIYPELAVVALTAPISYRGNDTGHIVVWSDLARLGRFLLPPPDASPYRIVLLTAEGGEVKPYPDAAAIAQPVLDRISRMSDGRVEIFREQGAAAAIVRHSVPGTPLLLATVLPEEVLSGGQGAGAFLLIAGIFPPLVVVATLLFERMRRRNAQVELALRASRLRLMGISDNLVEGIALVGDDWRILFVNRPALGIMGLAEQEPKNLVGEPLDALFRLGKANSSIDTWRQTINREGAVIDGDAVFVAPSGREIAVAYGCTPLIDPEHGSAIIVSFRDISALKQAQIEAMRSARLVSIGQLAAGIAHEINTPAQYISDNLGYVEDGLKSLCAVVERTGPDQKIARLLSEMPQAVAESREGVAQIARIVLSMKEFSHPGNTSRAATDINRAIDNTLTVSRNAWKHVAEIQRDFDPMLPLVVCHGGEINQVFLNLIMNAAQAIEASGKNLPGRITITTRSDGDKVEISVTDSGNGVPATIRDHIFDPFFTTKEVGKGTGQGLAICRDVVMVKHGGTLTVGGDEGNGAVFTVRLPIDAGLSAKTGETE